MTKRKPILINGREYKNLTEACNDQNANVHNLSYQTILYRMSKGMSAQKAFSKRSQKEELLIKGKYYDNLIEACNDKELNKYNLTYAVVQYRRATFIENDHLFDLNAKRVGLVFRGKEYETLAEICLDKNVNIHNISYKTIYSRLHRGVKLENVFDYKLEIIRSKKGDTDVKEGEYKW